MLCNLDLFMTLVKRVAKKLIKFFWGSVCSTWSNQTILSVGYGSNPNWLFNKFGIDHSFYKRFLIINEIISKSIYNFFSGVWITKALTICRLLYLILIHFFNTILTSTNSSKLWPLNFEVISLNPIKYIGIYLLI